VEEHPGRADRLVRWSLLDPIGWLALQATELFFAGALVRGIDAALGGDMSPGFQWGVFGAVLLALALFTYLVRRRYVAEHPADRPGAEGTGG
jgi:hypothetical protein